MNSEIIKNGNTCTVFRHENLVIKRYNIKSVWHFIKTLQFIKSRGLELVANFIMHLQPTRTFHRPNSFFLL